MNDQEKDKILEDWNKQVEKSAYEFKRERMRVANSHIGDYWMGMMETKKSKLEIWADGLHHIFIFALAVFIFWGITRILAVYGLPWYYAIFIISGFIVFPFIIGKVSNWLLRRW